MEENLFSYGTLQLAPVQAATFGRELSGKKDILTGYKLTTIAITDEAVSFKSGLTHHPIVAFTGIETDFVEGTVLNITHKEILHADAYEVDDYKRVAVTLKSGCRAWVYVYSAH